MRIDNEARKEEENHVELLKERKELKKADLFWNQFLRKKTTSKSKDTNKHEQKSSISLVADDYIGPKISAPTEKYKDGLSQ